MIRAHIHAHTHMYTRTRMYTHVHARVQDLNARADILYTAKPSIHIYLILNANTYISIYSHNVSPAP